MNPLQIDIATTAGSSFGASLVGMRRRSGLAS
jgi:hypothetical protein